APEDQRRAAVQAQLVQEAEPAVRVAEGDEALAQDGDLDRRAVGLGQVTELEGRRPVPPEHPAHRRVGPDPAQSLVLLCGQHASSFTTAGWYVSTPWSGTSSMPRSIS